MYKAGLKQKQTWVKRTAKKRGSNIDQKKFIQKLKKLASGMSEADQSSLYSLFLQIAEAKKEVLRIKNKK